MKTNPLIELEKTGLPRYRQCAETYSDGVADRPARRSLRHLAKKQ